MLPGALYELGVAVTVSLSVAPQLVQSVQRVHRARRLRAGQTKGLRALRGIVVPVLEDALERSLRLAAAMDSRGYGRAGTATPRSRRATGALMLLGMCGLCAGAYGLLDATAPPSSASRRSPPAACCAWPGSGSAGAGSPVPPTGPIPGGPPSGPSPAAASSRPCSSSPTRASTRPNSTPPFIR